MSRPLASPSHQSGTGLLIRRIAAVPVALVGAGMLAVGGVLIAIILGESTNEQRVEACHPVGPSISMIGLAIAGGAMVLLSATIVRRGVDRKMVGIAMAILLVGVIVFFAADSANAGCPLFE